LMPRRRRRACRTGMLSPVSRPGRQRSAEPVLAILERIDSSNADQPGDMARVALMMMMVAVDVLRFTVLEPD
jgi:hypothetical protein